MRLESGEHHGNVDDSILNAQLFTFKIFDDHYRDIINLLSMGYTLEGFNTTQKKQLVVKAAYFQLIAGQLYKMGLDEILHHYVLEHERPMMLNEENVVVEGGHYVGKSTVCKILQEGLWCSTLHANFRDYCCSCDIFQITRKWSQWDEMTVVP